MTGMFVIVGGLNWGTRVVDNSSPIPRPQVSFYCLQCGKRGRAFLNTVVPVLVGYCRIGLLGACA